MDALTYLLQVRKLDRLINAKIAERERLLAIATDISAKPISGMPHSNTGTVPQTMQNAVVNLVMLADEINHLIDRYVDCKKQITDVLEQLPEKEYAVLHGYYIQGKTWEQVADDVDMSVRNVARIKKKGLKNLQELLQKFVNVLECPIIK